MGWMLSTKYSVMKTKDFCYKMGVTGRGDGGLGVSYQWPQGDTTTIRWQEALNSLPASTASSVSATCFSDGVWFILYSISYSAASAEALLWTEASCRSPVLTQSCIPCDPSCILPGSTAESKVFLPSSSVNAKALAGLLGPWQCRSPSFLPR